MSRSTFTWGTVDSLAPLRVLLDGDTDPLPFIPDSLLDAAVLTVGDRVRCERAGRRLLVLGRSGGGPALATDAETQAGVVTDHAVTPSNLDLSMVHRGDLSTADLDTILMPGVYGQWAQANATLARHYPVAAHGGVLEVASAGGTGGQVAIVQRYTERGQYPGAATYQRFWNPNVSTWSNWSLVDARMPQGVIPSSVVVGSGSASVAADGMVTFSGVSSIALDGVFDGTGADIYTLYLEYKQTTGTNGLSFVLRNGGTDSTTGYDTQRLQIINTVTGPLQTLNSSSGVLVITTAQTNAFYGIVAEIFSPGLAIETRALARGIQSANPMSAAGGQGAFSNAVLHRSATAYDGMKLTHTVGTDRSTGQLKVVKIA